MFITPDGLRDKSESTGAMTPPTTGGRRFLMPLVCAAGAGFIR
jgi:hypothetical protein